MKRSHNIAIGAALVLSVVAVGGAIGATKLTPKQESEAVINDAAKQLGVQPDELSKALKQGLKNRVDAAVEAGRLTKEQAALMKERIDANEIPVLGLGPHRFGHRGHHGPRGPFMGRLEAAAKYLGMKQIQLHEALRSGKTLARIARDRDKSVDGLIDAMVDEVEQDLDRAVEAGRMTQADKADMLKGMKERITRMVNSRIPVLRPKRGAYFRPSVF